MSHAALAHTVNGFFDVFKSKPSVAARPASRAAQVMVESRYNEGDDESLLESATSLPRPTLKALEKAIRSDGFKGALVSGWGQGQRGGFTVHYGGQQYEFEISENVTPRPTGELGRLVKESGRYGQNGRGTGILSDGTRVNAYRYQGAGDEWTAALHYPDGGYSALRMSGRSAEFDEHDLEGPHMGTLIPWDAVPGNIKRDIEQRAVESSMVANGHGIYHETAVAKHDMVLVPDHRGRWRIDLVTSAGGNHIDVTQHQAGTAGNSGYSSPELAFRSALDIQRARGIRGKSHVWIADRDGGLTDYEPMERNGKTRPVRMTAEETRLYRSGEMAPLRSIRATAQDRANRNGEDVSILTADGEEIEWCTPLGAAFERNGRFEMKRTSPDPGRAGMHRYGPATVWVSGPVSGTWWATVKLRSQEKDLDAKSYEGVLQEAADWIDAAPELSRNGRATTVDPVAARELDLYIANTFELVGAKDSIGKSIDANLTRKLKSGKYDPSLAPKAWQHLVDKGAERYQKEFGSGSPIFNAATRRQVAEDFARAWEGENGL